MMKLAMRLAVVAVFLLMAFMAADTKAQPKTAKNEALRQELLQRMRTDQDARRALPMDIKKLDLPTVKRLQEIDCQNTKRMKEIVNQNGWPGKSLVGTDGAHAAWLLVQHADHDRPFQKRCLGMLKEAVKKGEATGEELAYLTDRVCVGEKKQQVYGTQLRWVDGKLRPQPIEDAANVDKRRKAVGLSPLADYLKFAEKALKVSSKGKSR